LFFDYPEFEWSGKKLKVKPPEPLKPQTTYVLTIGSSAIDNRGNKLGKSISFPFSTGEEIYAGSITGRVLPARIAGVSVWAYRLEQAQPDTFWKKLPDYVTQPDSLGNFEFEYLSSGVYLVIAAEDKNNDQFWEPPSERMALPDTFMFLSDSIKQAGPLILTPVDRDTLAPSIGKVISPDRQTIRIEFSIKMDSQSVLTESNYLIHEVADSGMVAAVYDVFPASRDIKAVFIKCSDLQAQKKYKLRARNLVSAYNVVADTMSRIFDAGDIDTTAPRIESLQPPPGLLLETDIIINILFSRAMDTNTVIQGITISDTLENRLPLIPTWIYPNELALKTEISQVDVFEIKFDESLIVDPAGNAAGDTVIAYRYYIASTDTFGQITGKVVNAPGTGIIVSLEKIAGGEKAVFSGCSDDGDFMFDRLFPDTYFLKAFFDKNNNNRYDPGGIKPFEFAEPVIVYDDTVKVRARWETDIGTIDFQPARIDVDSF
jgi:hypothetical protein